MFHKTEIAGFREDEMIQHGYTQDITRLPKPFGYVHIFVRRLQIPAWMIVRNYDRAGSVGYRIGKDLPGMHNGFIYESFGYLANGINLMTAI